MEPLPSHSLTTMPTVPYGETTPKETHAECCCYCWADNDGANSCASLIRTVWGTIQYVWKVVNCVKYGTVSCESWIISLDLLTLKTGLAYDKIFLNSEAGRTALPTIGS